MKTNRLILLFLMLGVAAAQQTNSASSTTNTGTIAELKAKAEKGDPNAQSLIGSYYLVGQGVPLDYAEAVKWFRKAADQGNAVAQNNLGVCYANGNGVSKDDTEAVKWYQKAAEQGLALAQVSLAVMYDDGQGVETNYTEAAKWSRKAAEQGNIGAQKLLGWMYLAGQGVPQDYGETVKWYRKAAEQGDAEAQARLAAMYEDGKGVTQDYVEAAKWNRKAASQGDASAQYRLGYDYANGKGVIKDVVEAAKWYRNAAEQGDALGESSLGICYALGDGVPKDYVEAYKWFNLCAAQGHLSAAQGVRDSIAEQMTSEQIAEAQRRSAAFVPRKETPGSNSNSNSPVAADSPIATGTGFFITGDGYLISNYHVVKDATKVRLVTSAGLIDAKVVQVDAANDLALLKADGRFAPLPIVASRTVNLGGTVATIGFPDIGLQGFAPKLAKGEIASLSGAGEDPRYFQISVPVQPGNSGGALVDERGNVIGIVSAKLDASAALAASGALPENVNYAVKSSLLLSFLESVPAVSAKLKAPVTADRKFEDVVKSAQDTAVLVLVY
jgi:TPR repeat protein